MTTGRINQVATLRGSDPSRSSVKKKAPRDEAPSATRPPKRAATGGCFALNVVTSRRRPPRLSRNRRGRPRGLSLAAISALNSRDGPRNRRTRPASRTPSGDASRRIEAFPRKERPTHRSARAQGRQARRASPRPPRGVGDTAGRNQCFRKKSTGRGAAERTHEIRDDIRLRIAYQNKSNHRAPPEPTKAKAASAPAAGRKRIRPDDGGQHTSIRERGRARKP